jgi:hypothetical protein
MRVVEAQPSLTKGNTFAYYSPLEGNRHPPAVLHYYRCFFLAGLIKHLQSCVDASLDNWLLNKSFEKYGSQ